MLQNYDFLPFQCKIAESAHAGGRQRVKEMGQFVEQSSCLARGGGGGYSHIWAILVRAAE